MSVHPDYAKRYNQARDISQILSRTFTKMLARDRRRLSAIADDLRDSADLVKSGGYLIVMLTWPEDPERGSEVYGPFKDEAERMEWASAVADAAAAGDSLLKGVQLLLTSLDVPFPVQR